jgi:hypothetical protein
MLWLDHLSTFDWATIGKTVVGALIGAGLGSALIQGVFNLMAERRNRTAQATYLAMRLAVQLDAFGLACSDMIVRNRNAETPPDSEYPIWEGLPELPSYPDDTEGWVSLRRDLATRCLRFRSNIQASESLIQDVSNYTEDDLGDTLDEQAAQLGLEARRIVHDLQRGYGLGDDGGDYASSLEGVQARALKAMRDRRQKKLTRAARSGAPAGC